jgi:aerobic-type carbon monoxide dehydrogenase small subunit (CoxS/CutS family)
MLLLPRTPEKTPPDPEEIKNGYLRRLCPCTGYQKIVHSSRKPVNHERSKA